MDTAQHIEETVSKTKALAFKDLYDSNFGTLLFFAKRYVVSQEEAEDVVQEVFFKLWHAHESWSDIECFPAYLRKMTHNHCIDLLRRNDRRQDIFKELSARTESAVEADYLLAEVKAEVLEFYVKELPKLSDNYKKVFELSFVQDVENDKVAEVLNLSNGVVRTYKKNLRKIMRKAILTPLFYLVFSSAIHFL